MLTVILAIKNPNANQLLACLSSIAALKNNKLINLTIVSSGDIPAVVDFMKSFLDISIIESPPDGVYAAYNSGLEGNLSKYVMFMGADDLLLPGLDNTLNTLKSIKYNPDIIAAYSLMQDVGLSGPSKLYGSIIFRNWCQQGLIYKSELFEDKRFDMKYIVQADHKFNIELLSNAKTKLMYSNDVISHFSSGGLTSQRNDLLFREDLPKIVYGSYGFTFYLMCLLKRSLADIIKGKPKEFSDSRVSK